MVFTKRKAYNGYCRRCIGQANCPNTKNQKVSCPFEQFPVGSGSYAMWGAKLLKDWPKDYCIDMGERNVEERRKYEEHKEMAQNTRAEGNSPPTSDKGNARNETRPATVPSHSPVKPSGPRPPGMSDDPMLSGGWVDEGKVEIKRRPPI